MVTQGLFKRNGEFVAVKRFRLGNNDYLEPGDAVTKGKFRLYHIQSLFKRRIIGYKDSEWSKAMIANYQLDKPQLKPEIFTAVEEPVEEKPKKLKPGRKPKEKNLFFDTLDKD